MTLSLSASLLGILILARRSHKGASEALGLTSWAGGEGSPNRQRILSGKDGSTLFEFKSSANYLDPFIVASVGDMDGDGTLDFTVRNE